MTDFIVEVRNNINQYRKYRPKQIEVYQKQIIEKIKQQILDESKDGSTEYSIIWNNYIESYDMIDNEKDAIKSGIKDYFEIEGFICDERLSHYNFTSKGPTLILKIKMD